MTSHPSTSDYALSRFWAKFWLRRNPILDGLGPWLIALACICGLLTIVTLTAEPPFGGNPDMIFWLLNIDLILLILCSVLVIRRVARVSLARRKGMAGSKLHVRLVLIFSLLAAVPAIITTVFSIGFFHVALQGWFSERVKTAVTESQAVAEAYLQEHQQIIKADVLAMTADLQRQEELLSQDMVALERMLKTQSFLRNLPYIMIFNRQGEVIVKIGEGDVHLSTILTLARQIQQPDLVQLLPMGAQGYVQSLTMLDGYDNAYIYTSRPVDPKVLGHLRSTRAGVDEYIALEGQSSQFQMTSTMIFIVVILVMMLAAVWFALILARRLINPISSLMNTAERVRSGDMDARVGSLKGIEEFDILGQSFNRMTAQIQAQQDDLMSANRQLDYRRNFTETILGAVSNGIISVDKDGLITLCNSAAGRLLHRNPDELIARPLAQIMPEIAELMRDSHTSDTDFIRREVQVRSREGGMRIFLIQVAMEALEADDKGRSAVITFDDVTDAIAAQKKAAWADVARRIAHEIKNPLTPIQLSAERLSRKYSKVIEEGRDKEVFLQCTDTIIRHVGDIQSMVNAFSTMAKMPEPVFEAVNLSKLVANICALQMQGMKAQIIIDDRLSIKKVMCDEQQIRQVLVNLIKNANDAMEVQDTPIIRVSIIEDNKNIWLGVCDNGPGLPIEGRDKLTEPYVTHKEKGTGLGLAIVKKIIEDHQGVLMLDPPMDTVPGEMESLSGAHIFIKLPIKNEGKPSA